MLIGLSLCFCIKDIISGEILEPDVRYIIANTCCVTEDDWTSVEKECLRLHWNNDIRGSSILKRLREAKKIIQPRLTDPEFRVNLNKGRWFVNPVEQEFLNEQVPSSGFGFSWLHGGSIRSG